MHIMNLPYSRSNMTFCSNRILSWSLLQALAVLVNSCQFLSILVSSCQFLSVLVSSCQFLSFHFMFKRILSILIQVCAIKNNNNNNNKVTSKTLNTTYSRSKIIMSYLFLSSLSWTFSRSLVASSETVNNSWACLLNLHSVSIWRATKWAWKDATFFSIFDILKCFAI